LFVYMFILWLFSYYSDAAPVARRLVCVCVFIRCVYTSPMSNNPPPQHTHTHSHTHTQTHTHTHTQTPLAFERFRYMSWLFPSHWLMFAFLTLCTLTPAQKEKEKERKR